MLDINIEKFDDIAVVVCKGRIVQSDDVFKFRDFVVAQEGSRQIAVDLAEVESLGGGGLGMLAYLQNWAQRNHIELHLVSPSTAVLDQLSRTSGISFHIAEPLELMDSTIHRNDGYGYAA